MDPLWMWKNGTPFSVFREYLRITCMKERKEMRDLNQEKELGEKMNKKINFWCSNEDLSTLVYWGWYIHLLSGFS